jgi:hypothetical protein
MHEFWKEKMLTECRGLVDLSYPPLLVAIFVSGKAESTQCSHPT